jgi:hypothetical protein
LLLICCSAIFFPAFYAASLIFFPAYYTLGSFLTVSRALEALPFKLDLGPSIMAACAAGGTSSWRSEGACLGTFTDLFLLTYGIAPFGSIVFFLY